MGKHGQAGVIARAYRAARKPRERTGYEITPELAALGAKTGKLYARRVNPERAALGVVPVFYAEDVPLALTALKEEFPRDVRERVIRAEAREKSEWWAKVDAQAAITREPATKL